jgi:hypothetical protein
VNTGPPVYTIAGARRVVRQDVTSYLDSELDAYGQSARTQTATRCSVDVSS